MALLAVGDFGDQVRYLWMTELHIQFLAQDVCVVYSLVIHREDIFQVVVKQTMGFLRPGVARYVETVKFKCQ